jgi:hypothetical protein
MVSAVIPPQAGLGAASDSGSFGADPSQHEQQFEALLQHSQAERLDAVPATSSDGIVSGVTARLDAISRGLRVGPTAEVQDSAVGPLAAGDPSRVSPPADSAPSKTPADLQHEVDKALDRYGNTVTFSIQAHLTVTYSTTITKTVNQLLRGA